MELDEFEGEQNGLVLPDSAAVQEQMRAEGPSVTFLNVALGIVARLEQELLAGVGASSGSSASRLDELRFVRDCLTTDHEFLKMPCALMSPSAEEEQDVEAADAHREVHDSLRKTFCPQGTPSGGRRNSQQKAGQSPKTKSSIALRGMAHKPKDVSELTSEPLVAAPNCDRIGLPFMGAAVPLWPVEHLSTSVANEIHWLMVNHFNHWNFDIFHLTRLSDGRPLQFAGWESFRRDQCFVEFHIDPGKAMTFLQEVARQYLSEHKAPYHNHIHAADVTQTVHAFQTELGLSEIFNPMDNLVTTLAAVVHDVGHDGRNNAFHVNSRSNLALTYNDRSVLENYHASTGFNIILRPDCNLLEALGKEQFDIVRKELIDMVLHTDMTHHFGTVGDFQDIVRAFGSDRDAWQADEHAMHVLRAVVLHSADISNQAKTSNFSQLWSRRALTEYFMQGDQELGMRLPVSPLCDRSATNVPGSQVGFIQFIVQPSYKSLTKLLPKVSEICLVEIEKNRETWECRQEYGYSFVEFEPVEDLTMADAEAATEAVCVQAVRSIEGCKLLSTPGRPAKVVVTNHTVLKQEIPRAGGRSFNGPPEAEAEEISNVPPPQQPNPSLLFFSVSSCLSCRGPSPPPCAGLRLIDRDGS